VMAAPLADTLVRTLDFAAQVDDERSRQVVFVCELWQDDTLIGSSVATFAPNKHLELTPSKIVTVLSQQAGQIVVELAAPTLARHVELALDGADVVWSDNYFDLPAGRSRTISAPLPAGWTVAQAVAALRVRSLYEAFA
jgi:beta-mannosidase